MRPNTTVNCRLSSRELSEIDSLVERGFFRNRSDAIRTCVTEYLLKIRYEEMLNRASGERIKVW